MCSHYEITFLRHKLSTNQPFLSPVTVINIIGIFVKREKSENLREIIEKQEQLFRESLLSDKKVLVVPFNSIIKIFIRLYL